jgi:hypothetical protein
VAVLHELQVNDALSAQGTFLLNDALSVRSYQNLQQYDRAIPLLERSLDGIDAAGQRGYYWLPQVLASLGISYRQLQQFEKAERTYLRCLELAEAFAANAPANLTAALTNLGSLYVQVGRLEEAEACLARGSDLLQGNPRLPWEPLARVLRALAATLAEAGLMERAEAVYLRCAQLCMLHSTIPPVRPWSGESGGLLATMLGAAGCPDELKGQVAARENFMASHLLKVLGLGSQPRQGGTVPKEQAEPNAPPDSGGS